MFSVSTILGTTIYFTSLKTSIRAGYVLTFGAIDADDEILVEGEKKLRENGVVTCRNPNGHAAVIRRIK